MAGVRGQYLALWAVFACVSVACGQQSTHGDGTWQPRSTQTPDTAPNTTPHHKHPAITFGNRKHHKPLATTDDGVDEQAQRQTQGSGSHYQHPEGSQTHPEGEMRLQNGQGSHEARPLTNKSAVTKHNTPHPEGTINEHKKGVAVRTAKAQAHTATKSVAAQQQELRSATSLAGTLLLLLISLVIAGSLFVMLLCFVHKWRENMGTGRYPRVVYSMLRQSEDEPEDVLGEILINIGLADPQDFNQPPSPSSTSTTPSPQPTHQQLDLGLEVSRFTTIPLHKDEAALSLLHPEPEESDEELLQ